MPPDYSDLLLMIVVALVFIAVTLWRLKEP
jgi:uncharacterized membrane protein YwzB